MVSEKQVSCIKHAIKLFHIPELSLRIKLRPKISNLSWTTIGRSISNFFFLYSLVKPIYLKLIRCTKVSSDLESSFTKMHSR